MTSRRTLLSAVPFLALAACTGSVQTDTQLISAGIDVIVPVLLAKDPKDADKINAAAAQAKTALAALAAPGDKATAAERLSSALDTLAVIAATYAPPEYAGVIPAAVRLAELMIAQAMKQAVAAGPGVRSGMTAEQARATLRAAR